jgi:hypothetical protein
VSRLISGQKMPLCLKLWDSAPDKKVRADVYNQNGECIKSVYLYHLEKGIYMNRDISAPDIEHCMVSYEVENSEDYSPVTERFFIDKAKVEEPKFILGVVKEKINTAEYIKGVIYETSSIK